MRVGTPKTNGSQVQFVGALFYEATAHNRCREFASKAIVEISQLSDRHQFKTIGLERTVRH